jgi:RES domain-containing protein
MIAYRLCKQEFCKDLSGYGAEKAGGRWNPKGYAALYTAGSRALAVLEVAVHIPLGIMPTDYYMTAIEIPDSADIHKLNIADLPTKWNRQPISNVSQHLGHEFITNNLHLVLQVPSVTVTGEYNFVINPKHPDFKKIKIVETEVFEFDSRLFKK